MTREESIAQQEKERDFHLKFVNRINANIQRIKELKDIDIPTLYKELGKITDLKDLKTDAFEIRLYKGEYEHLLGFHEGNIGWSKETVGIICEVKSIYHLDIGEERVIADYFRKIGEFNAIEFI